MTLRRRLSPALGGGVLGLRHLEAVIVAGLFFFAAAPVSAQAAVSRATTSIVARATGPQVAVYRIRAAKRPAWVFRNPRADGSPVTFLVVRRVPGWVQVRLAIRPNGSSGWVRAGSVALTLNPYRIAVSLRRHRITVWLRGRAIVRAPAAVGRPSLPTPTGVYYIVELLKQTSPSSPYGPYAFGLSAYSRVLLSFGGGPGQIGLHGTNEPGLLGTSVSHGCVRVANSLIARLARVLPLGTPVEISNE